MKNNNPSENFNSDPRWLTIQQLTTFHQDLDHTDDPDAWLYLGSYQGQPLYLTHDRARQHVLLVGDSVLDSTPQGLAGFWQHFHDPRQSLVFFDPNAELKRLLAPRLSKTHEIWEIAPGAPENSLKYNPLAFLDGTLAKITAREDAATQKDIRISATLNLAQIYLQHLVPDWSEATPATPHTIVDLVAACIMHLTATSAVPSLQSLSALLNRIDQILPDLSASSDDQVRYYTASFTRLGESDRATITRILTHSAFKFEYHSMHEDILLLTARNEIDFTSLLKKPIALFYTPPLAYAQDWQLITALLFNQLTDALFRAWYTIDAPQGIRFVINQSKYLGTLPDLERLLNLKNRANIAFVMAISDHGSLTKLYGEKILQAFKTHLVLPGVFRDDCAFYAARHCSPPAYDGWSTRAVNAYPLFTPHQLNQMANGHAFLDPYDFPPAMITFP